MADAQQEENLIKEYFSKGFEYKEIIEFLTKNHSINMSIATLKRRIKVYGLQRKNADYDIDVITEKIRTILDGPGCIAGYRHVWHTLKLQGISVPRSVVQHLIKQLDPEGVEQRKAHKLRRRMYHNRGPNDVWHCDGYDKLKPFGFPIHACIDGWSRKILWLYVTRSNNLPQNIAAYYLETVRQLRGCPMKLVTDLGTEN
ncbi:RNA-directed DNA polymerase from mobile element jockey, partial [Paramuricea clavata]